MKYIKKVSASQLISNEGTIIDSMNPGDDQTVNAPSIHAVKDYVEDNVENYSTTEQRIGTWIDGKPIYRKVFTGETGSGTNIQKRIYFPGVDNIINAGGYYFSSSSPNFKIIVLGNTTALTYDTDYLEYYFNNSSSNQFTYAIIVEYTKTTD